MTIWRRLALVLLILAIAGFGLCSLCGGVIGVMTLTENRASSRDIAWTAFGFSAAGAFVTWLCWWGYKALRRTAPDA